MKRSDRKILANIVFMGKYIYGLQDKLEKEQERIVEDIQMPAKQAVQALIALDNKRIDLCNLKVLGAFIARELGDELGRFKLEAESNVDSPLFERALHAIGLCGYDTARAASEFGYLFVNIKRKKRTPPPSAGCGSAIFAS